MSEGQGMSGYFKEISLKIIMIKFEENPFKINSFDLEGQCHLWIKVVY
jgi:hypothetical protein